MFRNKIREEIAKGFLKSLIKLRENPLINFMVVMLCNYNFEK